MALNVIDGNLLDLAEDGHFDVIVQGCNCLCVMGAGIALQIANRYPQAYEADKKTVRGDRNKLGHYTYAMAKNKKNGEFVIVNAYTQYDLGSGEDVLNYEALDNVLKEIKEDFAGLRIGLPLIGCGLAGGNEKRVVSNIKEVLGDENVTIVRFVKRSLGSL